MMMAALSRRLVSTALRTAFVGKPGLAIGAPTLSRRFGECPGSCATLAFAGFRGNPRGAWAQPSSLGRISSFATQTAPETTRTENESLDAPLYEYVAPFGAALKRVKILSVGSLIATFSSLPVMVYLQGGQFSGRIGAVMTVGFFSLFTTGMLHWFSSPYICFLRHRKGSEEVEVETCSMVATKKVRRFKFDQMEAPDGSLRPLISFEVEGQPFYVDDKHLTYQPFLERIPADPDLEQAAGEEGESQSQ